MSGKEKWWLDRNEVIWRLDALGEQLRSFPNAIIRTDGWETKRLNIIGKAIGCLTDCLLYIKDEEKEKLDKLTEEDMCWYVMAMKYWK